jgi:hypothetical protein
MAVVPCFDSTRASAATFTACTATEPRRRTRQSLRFTMSDSWPKDIPCFQRGQELARRSLRKLPELPTNVNLGLDLALELVLQRCMQRVRRHDDDRGFQTIRTRAARPLGDFSCEASQIPRVVRAPVIVEGVAAAHLA